jgi:hypothetical protein
MSSEPHRPQIFLGSSGPDLGIAEAFATVLEDDGLVNVVVWNHAFDEGETLLAGLFRILEKYDFGVFLLSATEITGGESSGAISGTRANVVLEFGMFAGRHGMKRTFAAVPKTDAAHLPSDLGGLHYAPYEVRDDNLTSGVRNAAVSARQRAVAVGRRPDTRGHDAAHSGDSEPDAWRIAARKRRLTPADADSLRLGDEIVDPIHGWGRVAELESGVGGEPMATVMFARSREAKLRVSRLFLADF